MEEKKFAFESGKVSVAFMLGTGLGDIILAKKVFEAIVELAPDCVVDILCINESRRAFALAFYGQSKNCNLMLVYKGGLADYIQMYDLAVKVRGSCAVVVEWGNAQRLQALAPKLLESAVKINEYNKSNFYEVGSPQAVALRNMMMSHVLHKNCYWLLSCGGALPIRDDKVDIPLLPEYKPRFDNLKLDNYITIYSDIDRNAELPKIKVWPMRHLVEYVSLMKKRFPQIEIVQCGGREDMKIENADRHFLNVDLELTKYILANSLLHVGCEGGLVHLATQLETKCLVMFGSSSPHFYGYAQNINLTSDVCHPCMYIWGHGGFQYCMRGAKEPPCMLSITPQLVCEVTCNYLKHCDLKINA